jgi:hypothetical protein
MATPNPLPDRFPDDTVGLTVRTASGHVHKLRAGWIFAEEAGGLYIAGVTAPGYFVSIRDRHVESVEQRLEELDEPTINGRPVRTVDLP